MSQNPSPEILRKLLRYDPATGKLFWRERPVEMFATKPHQKRWNARYAGKEAFTTVNHNGYLSGSIFGRRYLAHRIIWVMETGDWPADQLDHINHDRTNNRLANLREASSAENGRNQSRKCNNTSGVNGVYWNNWANKWHARIMVNYRWIHLGYFDDIPVAATARAAAEIKYGFHQNHGRPA